MSIEFTELDIVTTGLKQARHVVPHRDYRGTRVWGIEQLPVHWTEKPLKCAAAINVDKLADSTSADYELEYVDIGNVTLTNGITSTEKLRFENAPSRARRLVRHDDTIVSTVRTYLKAVAHIVNPPPNLVVSTGFAVLRAESDLHPAYLYRLAQSESFVHAIVAHSVGVSYPAINASDIGRFYVPLPPIEEQRAIAAFLDRETARIDELIAKKQRLIELLQEKRAALTSHAVTKGLNPSVQMKDSGVPWLGFIPANWSFLRLKHVAELQTGLTLGKKYDGDDAKKLISRPYLRVANVQDGWLDLHEITEVMIPADDTPRYELKPGDVLLTEGGDFDKLGRGYVWNGEIAGCLHQNHIFAVRPKFEHLDSHYLSALMSSSHGRNYFTSTSQQTTNLASTNSTKLRSFPIPLPPIQEQRDILSHLKTLTDRMDALTVSVQQGVQRLGEYRSALISAAVTGKIDVREESAA